MIKRLIFDVDGILIRGVNFAHSIEETLKKFNLNSEENIQAFIKGIGTYEQIYNNYNIADYTKHIGMMLKTKLPKDFVPTFFEALKTCIPTDNSEIHKTIRNLSKKYELVLLTNYFAESQMNRLNNMGIGKYFTECYGEHLIKPNTEAYINACGKNKPYECIMIGDDKNLDIKGAKKAGLNTIFVNTKKIDLNSRLGVAVNRVEDITDTTISLANEYEYVR
ncbi:MAG: HAD family hydrolase [Clostridia bacterium]|nr:HAD family hydrolase [Clostridia bacterium]